MNGKNLGAICAAALAMTLLTKPLLSQDEEEDPTISYRQSYMDAIGGHLGSARQLVSGGFQADGHLQIHAQALVDLTSGITTLFPEGSGEGDTAAKPVIWQDWDTFTDRAENAESAANAFLEAVESGDSDLTGQRFREMGRACRGCHKKFRRRSH